MITQLHVPIWPLNFPTKFFHSKRRRQPQKFSTVATVHKLGCHYRTSASTQLVDHQLWIMIFKHHIVLTQESIGTIKENKKGFSPA